MTLSELYRDTINKYKISPAEVIKVIEFIFKIPQEKFWSKKKSIHVNLISKLRFDRSIMKLVRGEPLAYIVKTREFYSESFIIEKGVLIPRPETELLVEKVIEVTSESSKVLDIGSGSGIIGITVAKITNANVTLLEISKKAIRVLKKNIIKHNLSDRVRIVKSNLFPENPEKFDIIVSNPPYISTRDFQLLEKKIKNFEPEKALFGGEDGLFYIRKIISESINYFRGRGVLLLEIGYDQESETKTEMLNNGFSKIEFFKDYAGISRVVKGIYENTSC